MLKFAQHELFFFQAEDGIRAADVTGVQTCALPIYPVERAAVGRVRRRTSPDRARPARRRAAATRGTDRVARHGQDESRRPDTARSAGQSAPGGHRSEERRVGKEWSARWSALSWKEK